MTWNYQIIKHDDDTGPWWGLHEVYRDDDGQPTTYTTHPIVIGDSAAEIWSALKMMLRDAQTRKILVKDDFEEHRVFPEDPKPDEG